MTVVIDASVGIALVRPEAASLFARAAVDHWLTERVELVVPAHFWIEIVNALSKGHRDTGATVIEALYELDQLRLTTAEVDRPILLGALDLVERWGLTAYDATYLSLAHSLNASLATFDRELIVAGGTYVVELLDVPPHRLSEERAPYGTPGERPVSWPMWSGAASYLATLRRRAMEDAGPARPGGSALSASRGRRASAG